MTLLVAEVGLRIAGVEFPDFYQYDARRGWVLEPGRSGWFRAEGESFVTISSQGLRDREHTVAKPANTFRIAVLGDSFAEALQVPAEKTFWALLERELPRCPRFAGKAVEVINFGVSSYGTVNQYLTLQDAAWQFNPDLVLLAFFTSNDFRDNSPALDTTNRRPFYRLVNGKLELDLSRNQPPSLARSAWYRARRTLRTAQLVQRFRDVSSARGGDNELGVDDGVYLPRKTPEWQAAWEVTEALILALKADVERHGAAFTMATLSNGIQVNPDEQARRAFMKKIGVDSLFGPDDELARFGRDNSISVITTAPALLAYAQDTKRCLHGFPNAWPCDGHWNAEGHAEAGRIIARALCSSGSQ